MYENECARRKGARKTGGGGERYWRRNRRVHKGQNLVHARKWDPFLFHFVNISTLGLTALFSAATWVIGIHPQQHNNKNAVKV